MIAPILWAVVQLLPDVTIYIEQDLDGKRVDAHVHFEFVLARGNKRICIVEAKEEKFKQVMAQALLGCEVAADIDDSHEVYTVVTNVEKWIFLKNLDEEILCDESNALTFGDNGVRKRQNSLESCTLCLRKTGNLSVTHYTGRFRLYSTRSNQFSFVLLHILIQRMLRRF